jgi:hypothetical protein
MTRHRGEALQDAQQEAGQHGAGQRAHAADHDHHEAQHQEVHAHVVVRRVDRRVHHARQDPRRGRDAEHDGEALVDVDAQQPTVSRSAMPARTTMPKVVNCRKAKTAPMITAAKAK